MFIWTDEAIQCVKDLWGKQSASEIAGIIGHHSRSAVCGKAHRLGLAKLSLPRIFRPRKPRPRVQRFREPLPQHDWHYVDWLFNRIPCQQESASVLIDDLGQVWPEGVSLMELTSETCRWPLWTDVVSDQYCGARPLEGLPYCGAHTRIAYQPRRRV